MARSARVSDSDVCSAIGRISAPAASAATMAAGRLASLAVSPPSVRTTSDRRESESPKSPDAVTMAS